LSCFREHYNIEIKDLKQPLLLNRAKKSKSGEAEKGATEIICLIPELCFMTGMSEGIRNDIKIKKVTTHSK
jgi:aubergine-like protein